MPTLCYRECVHCSSTFCLFINFNITFHTEYCEGLIFIPPLAPPKGTSTTAHLKVMRVANACTSSISTSSLYLIPAIGNLLYYTASGRDNSTISRL